MFFHPLTQLFLALFGFLIVCMLPAPGSLGMLLAFYAVVLITPSRTRTRLTGPFLKLLAFAAVFLLLIHAVTWRPPGVIPSGIAEAALSFTRIAAIVGAVLYLARQVTGDEMYALLIDLSVPPALILILFRTLWLVPRFIERIDEVVLAQRMRGMRIDSLFGRLRAVIPSLTPIFASMLEETYEQAMTMTIRGFLESGAKTHVDPLGFGLRDVVALTAGGVFAVCAVAGVLIW